MTTRSLALLCALLALTGAIRVRAERRYVNARFGFSVGVPSGWRVRESDNADGATLTDPAGAFRLRAFGTYAAAGARSSGALATAYRHGMGEECGGSVAETSRRSVMVAGRPGCVVVWRCPARRVVVYAAFVRAGDTGWALILDQPGARRRPGAALFRRLLASWQITGSGA